MAITIYKRSYIIEKIRAIIEKYLPGLYDRAKVFHVQIQDRKLHAPIRKEVDKFIDARTTPLFTSVEIETINRCNNICSFCPVNKNADQRPFKLMDEALFQSIIKQLQSLDGRFYS